MKKIKFLVSFLLIITILSALFSFNTFAAGSSVSVSKSSVTVGSTVTATVTLDAGEAIYGVQAVINYDSNILEYKSGTAVGDAGTLKLIESPSGETKVSYTLTFTAKKAGNCTISTSDCFYSGVTADKGLSGASASVAVKDVTLSSNANLKSMRLTAGTLSPAFSPSVTTYSVTVDNSVTECRISAIAADSNASISVKGSAKLKIGANTRSVVVTAPSGTQKTYTVNITRSETNSTHTVSEPSKLETNIAGVGYTVATDISTQKLFNGFKASTAMYNETEVAVAVDNYNNYKIYYLKAADSDVLVPFTLNEETESFEKLQYITQGNYTYIISDIPDDKTLPENYYVTNTKISEFDVKCYANANSDFNDFFYLYCYSDGNYEFYRYDSKLAVLQRYPELSTISNPLDEITEKEETTFLNRFRSLSSDAKIIVILVVVFILIAIALVVLLIVRLLVKKNFDDFDDGVLFEEVSINGFDLGYDEVEDELVEQTKED